MWITATVAEQLRFLHEEPDHGSDLAAGLSRLGRDVALAVPSCLAVTITPAGLGGQAGLGGEVSVSMTAGSAAVLASLAVPLAGGGLLVLRAGEPGAFLLLADHLAGLVGLDHRPVLLDEHLVWPAATSAASLADVSVVDQAVGVLVDRGLPPGSARRELRRRAGEADTTIAAVSRALLASLSSDPGRS